MVQKPDVSVTLASSRLRVLSSIPGLGHIQHVYVKISALWNTQTKLYRVLAGSLLISETNKRNCNGGKKKRLPWILNLLAMRAINGTFCPGYLGRESWVLVTAIKLLFFFFSFFLHGKPSQNIRRYLWDFSWGTVVQLLQGHIWFKALLFCDRLSRRRNLICESKVALNYRKIGQRSVSWE